MGLEVAATARELGLDVTVLEQADRVLARVTCPEVSAFYQSEHARHGVRIICGAQVRALEAGGTSSSRRVRAVSCDDGSECEADLVLIGVGVKANDELAEAAGLECANGIVVDQHCRTMIRGNPASYSEPSSHETARTRLLGIRAPASSART